jgi:hypothetical protein
VISREFSDYLHFVFNHLQVAVRASTWLERVACDVDYLTNADRACAVAAAAAHELNNELTVILNSVAGALAAVEAESAARPLLLDLRAATQRCAWKTAGLLNFSARLNPGPVRASFDYLIDQ